MESNVNTQLQLANDFIHHTGHNLFVTGKAGTGKTTFLHNLRQTCPKRMIVTAPTGVAAINAGGVTLHSFFQLPFGPFIPASHDTSMQQRRFSKEKINIIKSLDLLVIDEISMVRADTLDAIDAVLRRYKNRNQAFGGVQLLMIGDLHQLAPVVKDDERQLLQQHYATCYFFSSQALSDSPFISLELQHIYRQSDPRFIELLNKVRDGAVDAASLQVLNSRYRPDAQASDSIRLTTHNRKADAINNRELELIPNQAFTFNAIIEGDYPEYAYPTAESLTLKLGAQVMFVRNDAHHEKRYFNGKLGKVTQINQDRIKVLCPGDAEEIEVTAETWENIKYGLNPETNQISEEVVGSFTQVPLRPAWAITIHKSQGLTFEQAIIDAEAAFSHGQVYVALSRCKTFEGLVLSSPLSQNAIKTDLEIQQFVQQMQQAEPDTAQLHRAKVNYQQQLLLACFDFNQLASPLNQLAKLLRDYASLVQANNMDALESIKQQTFTQVIAVADKFKHQLQSLFQSNQAPESDAHVQQRVQKAVSYFSEQLQNGLQPWLQDFAFDADNKEIRKQISKAVEALQTKLTTLLAGLHSCARGFNTTSYLNAVAEAAIELKSPRAKPTGKVDLLVADLTHPALFQQLKDWRNQQANTEQVAHYRIMHQKVMLQIAELLPSTQQALLAIHGVGNALLDKYGAAIIQIVTQYCQQHDIAPTQHAPATAKLPTKDATQDSKQLSLQLLHQGNNIVQIAELRGLAPSTIEGHLAHFIKQGELQVSQLLEQPKISAIQHAIESLPKEPEHGILKALKAALGDEFSYGEIKLVLAQFQANQA